MTKKYFGPLFDSTNIYEYDLSDDKIDWEVFDKMDDVDKYGIRWTISLEDLMKRPPAEPIPSPWTKGMMIGRKERVG
jgi:hypothetical protein